MVNSLVQLKFVLLYLYASYTLSDYIKGDSAYLYVYKTTDEEQQLVKTLGSDSPNKDLIRTYILKGTNSTYSTIYGK